MVVFHPLAKEEHDVAITYYASVDEALGRDFDQRVSTAVSLIEEDPERWRVRKHGVRRVNLKRFPFYIAYLAEGDLIWVVAVAHVARRPFYWRHRIEDVL